MQDILSEKQNISSDYYQSNHAQFYRMARMRQQQDVLNRMQQTYENYSTASAQPKDESEKEAKKELHSADKNETSANNTPNFNLSNIANILGGNADFSKILLNALSGQNKDLANILKIINNPLVKNSLSKKHTRPVNAESSGDVIECNNEIDKLEKIEDN